MGNLSKIKFQRPNYIPNFSYYFIYPRALHASQSQLIEPVTKMYSYNFTSGKAFGNPHSFPDGRMCFSLLPRWANVSQGSLIVLYSTHSDISIFEITCMTFLGATIRAQFKEDMQYLFAFKCAELRSMACLFCFSVFNLIQL